MPERERTHPKEPTLRYPSELVHRYGAKAGLLMHVARHLPDIPQAAMIVSEPGESTDDLLRRADEQEIFYPRLFRSSAVAELDGYEGDFPTIEMESFEEWYADTSWRASAGSWRDRDNYVSRATYDWRVRDAVETVRNSPRRLREQGHGVGLPKEINVIVAEKSPSRYFGTYVKHPNKDDEYLMAITDETSPERDRDRANYKLSGGGLSRLKRHVGIYDIPDTPEIQADLQTVASWHDRIAQLPEMDPSWAYQIEFGIAPVCLYQVRPFKPVEKSLFTLGTQDYGYALEQPIAVIGTTPPDGIVGKAIVLPTYLSSDYVDIDEFRQDPSVFIGDLRSAHRAERLDRLQVNVFRQSNGMLAHNDIKAIRKSRVTALFPGTPYLKDVRHTGWLRVTSDGNDIVFERTKKPKNNDNILRPQEH